MKFLCCLTSNIRQLVLILYIYVEIVLINDWLLRRIKFVVVPITVVSLLFVRDMRLRFLLRILLCSNRYAECFMFILRAILYLIIIVIAIFLLFLLIFFNLSLFRLFLFLLRLYELIHDCCKN